MSLKTHVWRVGRNASKNQLQKNNRLWPGADTGDDESQSCQLSRSVQFYMKRKFNQNLSGDEVYYAACSLLVILENLCSKLDCQQGFNSILFSYKIRVREERRWTARCACNAEAMRADGVTLQSSGFTRRGGLHRDQAAPPSSLAPNPPHQAPATSRGGGTLWLSLHELHTHTHQAAATSRGGGPCGCPSTSVKTSVPSFTTRSFAESWSKKEKKVEDRDCAGGVGFQEQVREPETELVLETERVLENRRRRLRIATT